MVARVWGTWMADNFPQFTVFPLLCIWMSWILELKLQHLVKGSYI